MVSLESSCCWHLGKVGGACCPSLSAPPWQKLLVLALPEPGLEDARISAPPGTFQRGGVQVLGWDLRLLSGL